MLTSSELVRHIKASLDDPLQSLIHVNKGCRFPQKEADVLSSQLRLVIHRAHIQKLFFCSFLYNSRDILHVLFGFLPRRQVYYFMNLSRSTRDFFLQLGSPQPSSLDRIAIPFRPNKKKRRNGSNLHNVAEFSWARNFTNWDHYTPKLPSNYRAVTLHAEHFKKTICPPQLNVKYFQITEKLVGNVADSNTEYFRDSKVRGIYLENPLGGHSEPYIKWIAIALSQVEALMCTVDSELQRIVRFPNLKRLYVCRVSWSQALNPASFPSLELVAFPAKNGLVSLSDRRRLLAKYSYNGMPRKEKQPRKNRTSLSVYRVDSPDEKLQAPKPYMRVLCIENMKSNWVECLENDTSLLGYEGTQLRHDDTKLDCISTFFEKKSRAKKKQ